MNKNVNKLQTRDFISVGIFSLIYAAVAFIIGGVAQMTPITFPFMPLIIAGILLFITGMFWMMSAFFVVFGIIADVICASGSFKSFKKNMIAYCLFALSPMGAYVPMAIMPAQFDAFMSKKGDVSSFAGVIDSIGANWWAIPLMLLGTVLCALIGGYIGKKLLKKHFEKAGIV